MEEHTPIEIKETPWVMAALMLFVGVACVSIAVVAARDGYIPAMVCAGIFLAASIAAAAKSVRYVHLRLNSDGSSHFSVRDFRGWHHHEFAPGSLRAGVEHFREDSGVTGRVMLLVDGTQGVTRIPFAGHFGAPERAERTVARIMDWRNSTNAA